MTDLELNNLRDNLWHSADILRSGAHIAATNTVKESHYRC